MKIDLALDYQSILRNEPRPVHLVAILCVPRLEARTGPRPAAFAIVLDRSGTMAGEPLRLAREAQTSNFCAKSIPANRSPGLKISSRKTRSARRQKERFPMQEMI
jgi:hypothetical protein